MDVAQWLNGLGLEQYEALFREHEIDADVLVDLTEADLAEAQALLAALARKSPLPTGEGQG